MDKHTSTRTILRYIYDEFIERTAVSIEFVNVARVMKAISSIYKGIEYVQISTLPVDQRERLLRTINAELLIKILVDGKVIGNCLQFKDYDCWFDNVYRPSLSESKPARVRESARTNELAGVVALDKATH